MIDPVILVKFTFHFLSVVLSAQRNLENGLSFSSIWLNTFLTFSRKDLETPAWNKRKSEVVASQGQGQRAVRQAVAEGGSDRDVLRRLVEVLATLSSANAAELRELTATVFKTYLVPWSEPVAEAMAEAGRFYHEAAGAINDKPEAERAEAHEQLGPPFVHVWVAFLCSLAATKSLAPEHVATVKTYWEGNVVKKELASAIGGTIVMVPTPLYSAHE